MQRALEQICSRWVPLVTLVFLPLIIAMIIAFAQPREYTGRATIWALRRYEIVGATGPESDLSASPATTQSTVVTELLQTRQFALAVGKEANLASTYSASTRSNPDAVDTAIMSDLSKNVVVTALGYNAIGVTYINPSPAMAQAVVKAVVDQFGVTASQYSVAEAKQLQLVYQEQLQAAQQKASQALSAASKYLASHPGATSQNDLQYGVLLNAVQSTQNSVASAQTSIAQVNNEVSAIGPQTNGLYLVVDKPTVDSKPVSRTKTFLAAGGIGLAVGLLAGAMFLIVIMRRDRSVYSVLDLERITDTPILVQIPFMSGDMLAYIVGRVRMNLNLARLN